MLDPEERAAIRDAQEQLEATRPERFELRVSPAEIEAWRAAAAASGKSVGAWLRLQAAVALERCPVCGQRLRHPDGERHSSETSTPGL